MSHGGGGWGLKWAIACDILFEWSLIGRIKSALGSPIINITSLWEGVKDFSAQAKKSGLKNIKICVTSFMDDPFNLHETGRCQSNEYWLKVGWENAKLIFSWKVSWSKLSKKNDRLGAGDQVRNGKGWKRIPKIMFEKKHNLNLPKLN